MTTSLGDKDPERLQGTWILVVTAPMFAWLPWPTRTMTFEAPPEATWRDVHDMAQQTLVDGAYRISAYRSDTDLELEGDRSPNESGLIHPLWFVAAAIIGIVGATVWPR